MDPEFSDQMELFCPFYPDEIYNKYVPEQDEAEAANSKPRRRRNKKSKGGGDAVMRNKRKLSEEQVSLLEQSFESEYKLESERKDRLAAELGLDPRQVAVWFQNRRARWKNKKLEEEYSKLKSDHATTVVEKCRLETELLQLKEQLVEAGKELEMLSERRNGFTNNTSPSSSLSMEPPFLGEFVMDELDNVLYMPQANYVPGLEWDHLYLCN